MRCVDGSSVGVMVFAYVADEHSSLTCIPPPRTTTLFVYVPPRSLGRPTDQSQLPINMNRFTVSVTPGLVQSLEGGVPPVGGCLVFEHATHR